MVDTTQLVAEVKTKGVTKATSELDKFGKEAKTAEKGAVNFKKGANLAFSAVKVGATAIAGATAALTALTIKVSAAEKEWATLANIAGDSVDDFKATAFATEQVGISAEKLADISKDTKEKLGEFIATGGGGFKDFFEQVAPVIGVTASELQNLSGSQVLQRVASAMQDANIPMAQQSFYLESIASDTTNLLPLLADHGSELKRLEGRYTKLNESLALTANERGGLKQLSTSFDLLTGTAESASSKIAATLAPTLDSFFSSVTQSVPSATQTLIDFFNVFIATENLATIKAAEERLARINKEIAKFDGRDLSGGGQSGKGNRSRLERLKQDAIEAEDQIKKLAEEQKKLDDAKTGSFGGISGQINSGLLASEKAVGDQRIKIRRATLDELYEMEFAQQERDEELQRIRLASTQSSLGFISTLMQSENKKLFKIGQAAALANATISTAQAVTNALAVQPYPLGVALAAGAAAAGAVQISTISSQKPPSAGNYAKGGIIGGSSFAGDNITANVNSGEMILNKGQQKALFDMANGGGGGANITVINNAPNSVARAETASDGRIRIIVDEVLQSQVLSPNSNFNKNLDRTRKVQRQL